ncbi:type II toxin-antitoxin system VapC family toxin [Methylotuvimicrobium sp. KM2]|uniref:type II toxin-antitoxin system tRNA(fMet)-specific endonuclease VapC n=1 Tax=Methylotuvimicrobium sp. KM2 TaxID=3133976 RepID=UPI003101A786
MSFYLLDTNICIFLLNQRGGFENIIQRMDGMSREDIGISAITVAELDYGIAASKKQSDNAKRLERFLLDFEVIDFNRASATAYGPLRSKLQSQGTPIGPMDFLIAAHALALNAILVTNNTREFERVPGLRLEDWTLPR